MKRLIRCLLLFALGVAQHALAGGIIRIADGDCAALSSAAAATPGQEPALIVLARNGSYAACSLHVVGNITIDGAGAQMALVQYSADIRNQITIDASAQLIIRNANLGEALDSSLIKTPDSKFLVSYLPVVRNSGTLVLDSVSVANEWFGYAGIGMIGGGFIANLGKLRVRNSSFVNVTSLSYGLFNGDTEISHSTVTANLAYDRHVFGDGTMRVSNSVITYPGAGPICATPGNPATQRVSLGGNVVSDNSCAFHGTNDRVVADARFLEFGTHGGVAKTLALNYDSPAIGNGLLANCEATDARGLSRGATACDSGAYEVGGGDGKLSATGMSGLYFNSANNGHYISIQRLAGNLALVIWNTFDQNGAPAWLYGVGTVSGNQIHVEQVAQNVGGILHAGGAVSGATPTLWGTFDVNLSDCYTASLTYSSAMPQFGSGSTSLQRLAFLDGVNCAR